MSKFFGGGKDKGAERAAREQAKAIREAAMQQAEAARQAAQAAQIQREGIEARLRAEESARAMAPKLAEAPEVTVGPTPETTPEDAARKRNPRQAFQKKAQAAYSSVTL